MADVNPLPVRSTRHGVMLPGISRTTPRPSYLIGDETAFAVYIEDDSMAPIYVSGMMLHCVRTREPVAGDMAAFVLTGGRLIVRLIEGRDDQGFSVTHLNRQDHDTIKLVRDRLAFEDLSEVAVVCSGLRFAF